MGEHSKLLMLEAVLGEMRKENLLGQVRETGAVLLSGLEALEVHKCNQRMKQNQSCVVVVVVFLGFFCGTCTLFSDSGAARVFVCVFVCLFVLLKIIVCERYN